MSASGPETHAADDALVRVLDGEAPAGERATVEAHLALCARCAEREEAIRRRSAALRGLLAATEPAVPAFVPDELRMRRASGRARRALPTWARAAAAVVLLAGVALAVGPLRAWVAGWLAPPPPVPAAPRAAPAPAPAGDVGAPTRVRFAPTGPVLHVEIAPGRERGTLRLVPYSGREVVVGSIGGDVLVLPDRVRLVPGRGTEYRLLLPPGIHRVEVRGGGAAPATLDPREIPPGGERVVEIGAVDG
jgi:anti-sigma factor RsiW